MASAVGDIVAIAGVDDTKWVQGVMRMQNSTRQLSGTVSGDFGRSIGQVGFMIQDFSSVMSMGGKNALGRALMSTMNNVQMLGSAFGPWGLAITSVGGALASVLIPKLLESKEAGDSFAESLKKQVSEAEKLSKSAGDMARFSSHLRGIDTSKSAMGEGEKIADDMAATRAERAALEDRARRILQEGIRSGDIIPTGRGGADALFGQGGFTAFDDLPLAEQLRIAGGSEKTQEELDGLADKLEDFDSRLMNLGIKKGAIEERAEEIGENEFDEMLAKMRKEEAKELKEERERHERKAQQIADQFRSPFQEAEDAIADLAMFQDAGILDPDTAARAADRVVKEFKTKKGDRQKGPGATEGVEFGTKENFSAIQSAIRQDQNRSAAEHSQLFKQQLEQLRLANAELKRIGKTMPRSEGI